MPDAARPVPRIPTGRLAAAALRVLAALRRPSPAAVARGPAPAVARAVARVAAPALALALWLAAAPALARDDALPEPVRAEMARLGLGPQDVAFYARRLDGRGAAWQHRADAPMQPGSTIKVLTVAVALDRLSPQARGSTELLASGPVDAGVLRGPLVLRGGADAELGLAEFWQMLLELREQGVHTVAGDLWVDRTLFTPARPELGVPRFDEHAEFPYNVVPDALQLTGGLVGVEIASDAAGQVAARLLPALDGVRLASDLRPAPPGRACADWNDDWLPPLAAPAADGVWEVRLQGGFPAACTRRAWLQLLDRQRLAEATFRTLWRQLGGRWDGRAVEAAAPPGARVLARHEARPWFDLVRRMNKVSDNVMTRLLYLQLGLLPPGPDVPPPAPVSTAAAGAGPGAGAAGAPVAAPATAERADAVVRRWFAQAGIDTAGLVLDNGSGLSRRERLTARQLGRALEVALARPYAPELLASLPLLGRDAPPRARLRDSPALGVARLKGGTLRNAVGLAGRVQDAQGRAWVLVGFVNHETQALPARAVLDAAVDWFAREGPLARRAPGRFGPDRDGP